MFINAEPRYVSDSFGAFVSFHIADTALHQRLVEMTNNQVNACSVFGSVVPSTGDSWDGVLNEYSDNEDFQVRNLYGGYYPETAPIAQNQVVDLPETVTYSETRPPQYQSYTDISTSQLPYQELEINFLERPSPMLGNDYSQLSLGRGRGSFAEFTNVRNALSSLSDGPQVGACDSSFTSCDGLAQCTNDDQASTYEDSMTVPSTSLDTVYSNYTTPHSCTNCRTTGSTDNRDSNMATTEIACRQGNLHCRKAFQNSTEMPLASNGLPAISVQQYSNPWSSTSASTSTWDPQCLASNTISPKMLTLNVSSTSLSSSGSSENSVLALSDSSEAMTTDEPAVKFAADRPKNFQSRCNRAGSKTLPDYAPSSHRTEPMGPSNDLSREAMLRPMKVIKIRSHSSRKSSPPSRSILATSWSPVHSPQSSEGYSRITKASPRKIEPTPVQQAPSPYATAIAQATYTREAQDEFLINSRLAGMPYKDIRRQGNFAETESTLRGRFRTLTKDKTQRVRKPAWEENDSHILRKAVRKLATKSDIAKNKIPWKKVADYIASHGGSYPFGYSACRKHWDDLQERN